MKIIMCVAFSLLVGCGGSSSSPTLPSGSLKASTDLSRPAGCPYSSVVVSGTITVFGSGLRRAMTQRIGAAATTATFTSVPSGEKFVRVDAFDVAGNLIGSNANRLQVMPNMENTVNVSAATCLPETWTVSGTQSIDGVSWVQVRNNGSVLNLFRETAEGTEKLFTEFILTGDKFLSFSPPLNVAPISLQPGQQVNQTILVTSFDSRSVINQEVTFVGFEGVNTPGGDYPDALHFRYTPAVPCMFFDYFTDVWLVRGVGPVTAALNTPSSEDPRLIINVLASHQGSGDTLFPLNQGNVWTLATNAVGCGGGSGQRILTTVTGVAADDHNSRRLLSLQPFWFNAEPST